MQYGRSVLAVATVLTALAAAAPGSRANPLEVRLNQVQVLGSHNSYHIQPEQRILDVLAVFLPELAPTLEYTHIPLDQQFDFQGIRQIELDVFADPLGGLYANRGAYIVFGEDPASGLPELDQPGFKVLHVQDIDFDTTCLTLVDCLQNVKDWSDANPWHLPIMILMETKDDPIWDPLNLGFVIPIPIGPGELDDLDAEIRSVFSEDHMITPDDVRGGHATLEEAVLAGGWPTLWEAQGKVLFALDNGGSVRDDYVAGHPSLAGRVMFTSSDLGQPEAAFVKLNDPLGNEQVIADLVADGYIVRTRADADTIDARNGDTTRRDAALASGAQFVSTDYPVPDPFGMGYVVEIPDGAPARCNPINSVPDCLSSALEHLDGFSEIGGTKLLVRDRAGAKASRKIILVGKDALLDAPEPGSADDPIVAGATLMLSNPGTGETLKLNIPAGDNWKGLGKPAGSRGYVYRDGAGENGPCRTVIVRDGRLIKAKCLGDPGSVPFTLDESSQEALNATLQLGHGYIYCTSFGGRVKTDRPVSGKRAGVFVATDAPPGGCPIP